MAQRTVHYVFGRLLAASCPVGEEKRFLFGSLLPDAVADKSERDASHCVFRGADGTRYYDFGRFRRDFAAFIPGDPLCLGYYMHLVTDDFYREFCYKLHRFSFPRKEDVRALHEDYHLLNPYLAEKYGLREPLLPDRFESEPLARIARFDAEGLLRDFTEDLAERPQGAFTYLSPALIDSFISRYLPLAEQELRVLLRGGSFLRAADFAWNSGGKS